MHPQASKTFVRPSFPLARCPDHPVRPLPAASPRWTLASCELKVEKCLSRTAIESHVGTIPTKRPRASAVFLTGTRPQPAQNGMTTLPLLNSFWNLYFRRVSLSTIVFHELLASLNCRFIFAFAPSIHLSPCSLLSLLSI